jgi:hypothetical protein
MADHENDAPADPVITAIEAVQLARPGLQRGWQRRSLLPNSAGMTASPIRNSHETSASPRNEHGRGRGP